MAKSLVFIALVAFALLTASCGSQRNMANAPVAPPQPETAVAPLNLDGSVSTVIMLAGREDESRFQVEVFAGKEMLIDCNQHVLSGQFEERIADNGEVHLFFTTTGVVASTQMACLDNTQRLAFVSAPPHSTRYNSTTPIVVHAPPGITVKYRVWTAGETAPFPPTPLYANTHPLAAFPTTRAGYERFVLLLPFVDSPENRKVEIIPGKTAYIDCNRHVLGGTFMRENVQGWGFDFLVFNSDGVMAATRMACIDPPRSEFVAAPSEFVRYTPQMPVVVFVPAGFEVRYRVWEAPVIN